MTVVIKKQLSRLPIAPLVALVAAGVGGALVMATPDWVLNKIVYKSGLPGILEAATPPLGMTARLMLAGAAAVGVALFAFIIVALLRRKLNPASRKRPLVDTAAEKYELPERKSEIVPQSTDYERFQPTVPAAAAVAAAPAAYSRQPIFAERELGAPFMEPVLAGAPKGEEDVPFFAAPSFTPAQPINEVAQPAFDQMAGDALELEFAQIADIPEARDVEAHYEVPTYQVPEAVVEPVPVPEATAPVPVEPALAPVEAEHDDWTAGIPIPMDEPCGEPFREEWAAPVYQAESAPIAQHAPAVKPEPAAVVAPSQPAASLELEAVDESMVSTPDGQPDLRELLERFETGLRRRQLQSLVASSTLTGVGSSAAAADAALGEALGTLERLAASAR